MGRTVAAARGAAAEEEPLATRSKKKKKPYGKWENGGPAKMMSKRKVMSENIVVL